MARVATFSGAPVLSRDVRGTALAAGVPLSFWGGYDPDTGLIIDQRHPLAGALATGCILVIPSGRGSCSGSGVLLEAIVNKTAPAAIILSTIDPIIALGCILGDELYRSHPALIVIDEAQRRLVLNGDQITVDAAGWVTIER